MKVVAIDAEESESEDDYDRGIKIKMMTLSVISSSLWRGLLVMKVNLFPH